MKKVLIVSYSFPPFNNIAARRYGCIVKYMKDYGWEPYILTTNSGGNLPVEIDEQYIIRIGSRNKDNKSSSKSELPAVLSALRSCMSRFKIRFRTIDRSIINWNKLVREDISNLSEYVKESDLIIASYGPPAALWIGKYLSERYNKPWVADIRDLGAMRTDGRNRVSIWIDKRIEKSILSTTDGLITVSNTLSSILQKEYKKDTKTIYNGWDKSDIVNNCIYTSAINIKGDYSYIYYAGIFYKHRIDSLKMLLELLANNEYKDISLVIRSLGPKELEEEIIEISNKYGIKDRVILLEPCSPQIVDHEQANAMINLVIEDLDTSENWSKGTLTGKFLQLINQNPPVLAIARHDSEIGEILEKTEKGKLCSDRAEIDVFLKGIKCNTDGYIGNKAEIDKYSKRNQAEELSEFLNSVLAKQVCNKYNA